MAITPSMAVGRGRDAIDPVESGSRPMIDSSYEGEILVPVADPHAEIPAPQCPIRQADLAGGCGGQ